MRQSITDYQYPNSARTELIEFLPKQYQTVLEIGCGTGGFKQSLNHDIEIWGVEPNELASQHAELKGYKVVTGYYNDVESQCPDHYFDLIICNDVIEHMVVHEKILMDIQKKMKPNATLVGSIPNIKHYLVLFELLFKRDWNYKETGVLDKTHLRFLTEKSLKRTFEECGFTVEKFVGINGIKYWFTLKSIFKFLFFHLSFGLFKDTKYQQFAFSIKPKVDS